MSKSQETIVFLFPEPIRPYPEKYLQFCFGCLLKSVDRANDSLACEQLKEWVLKDRKILRHWKGGYMLLLKVERGS